ncbi:MAG: hypothetical protein HOW73_41595 [Polyangiaceae bacterium]|nr:hypothetical protein [Polyangiaceae bacterium]
MFHLEVRQGRLLEARVHSLTTLEDARAYTADLVRITGTSSEPLVLCADHRRVRIYSQVVSDELASLFGKMNSRLERVVVIVSRSNATLALQLERIVREAHNPMRHVYYDVPPAIEFLRGSLGPAEVARATVFLNEPL